MRFNVLFLGLCVSLVLFGCVNINVDKNIPSDVGKTPINNDSIPIVNPPYELQQKQVTGNYQDITLFYSTKTIVKIVGNYNTFKVLEKSNIEYIEVVGNFNKFLVPESNPIEIKTAGTENVVEYYSN